MATSIPNFPYPDTNDQYNNIDLPHVPPPPAPPPPAPPPPPLPNQTTIEDLESSIQDLESRLRRPGRWRRHCFPRLFGISETRQGHHDGDGDREQDQDHPNNNVVRAVWRTRLAEALESIQARIIVIVLLLADVSLTILDLASVLSCDKDQEDTRIYHTVGISILGLLSAKVLLLMMALGVKSFFMRLGYVFDGAVIIGALVLEVLVEKRGAALIVVASLWRVVRVVESVMELGKESIHVQIERIVKKFEELKNKHKNLEETLMEKNETIRKLEETSRTSTHGY